MQTLAKLHVAAMAIQSFTFDVMLELPKLKLNEVRVSNEAKRPLIVWDGKRLELSTDNSSIETFLGCNRSAQYRLVESRIGLPGAALINGATIHAGLEAYYKFGDDSELIYAAMAKAAAENPPIPLDDYRSFDYSVMVVNKYIREYSGENLKPYTIEGMDKPLVEFSFAMPLGAMEIRMTRSVTAAVTVKEGVTEPIPTGNALVHIVWTGIIDLVAEKDGELWLIDHKTTSMMGKDFFDVFSLAQQVVGYVVAGSKIIPGLKGFMVNAIATRQITKTGKGIEFDRRYLTYDQDVRDEWVKDTMANIGEFLSNLETGYFPKKTLWCVGKYGKCPYFSVCSSPHGQRSMVLHSGNFKNNTWKV